MLSSCTSLEDKSFSFESFHSLIKTIFRESWQKVFPWQIEMQIKTKKIKINFTCGYFSAIASLQWSMRKRYGK